jgi:hypothetical protein
MKKKTARRFIKRNFFKIIQIESGFYVANANQIMKRYEKCLRALGYKLDFL